ncbi:sprt family metallopeptidase [Purpureocillium lilacinum]|uniref:Sprt family metallopeptidase n=1 Tax=Purpureocillium lilacinum TaxID=33203 RepID=A0A179HS37_PURLI|nr:sprt family metallopeptidase [Purpureocillium lilacinum]OAQ93167.1 sprt family metallopeptidase [Purpureocillium lilacinum]PWI76179.1 hypothetical protein PCL_03373 [Purpureocillium lilacinum]
MARVVDYYPSSEDELPRLDALLGSTSKRRVTPMSRETPRPPQGKGLVPKSAATPSARKVRRFGEQQSDLNPLFLPWSKSKESDSTHNTRGTFQIPSSSSREGTCQTPKVVPLDGLSYAMREDSPPPTARASRTRRRLAARLLESDKEDNSICDNAGLLNKTGRAQDGDSHTQFPTRGSTPVADLDHRKDAASVVLDPVSAKPLCPNTQKKDSGDTSNDEEPSIYETAVEDSQSESESEGSGSEFELSDSSEDLFERTSTPAAPPIARVRRGRQAKKEDNESPGVLNARSPNVRKPKSAFIAASSATAKTTSPDFQAGVRQPQAGISRSRSGSHESAFARDLDVLRAQLSGFSDDGQEARPDDDDTLVSPPSTPPRKVQSKGLVSPRKQGAIPETPHPPSVDAFWNKDFVDDWNEQHSPRKAPTVRLAPSPAKGKAGRAAEKRAFDARKAELAEEFFRELNEKIADGKISELAKATGGVKLVWTKTLNTTAGRANWKRETIRTKKADGTVVAVSHKHHASIELAEKVIDDDNKLLNVLAHEFCHLANFMITGIANNPHGKEFKAWAAKCSRAFGESHGIQVTTKHAYDIDFKYTWQCSACGSEYKRHSRSIDPQRHRCGSCKGTLTQTKPCPRGTNAGAGKVGKPTEYQMFVKEQMKIVRGENPNSPQKEVMRIVADKWAKARKRSMPVDDAVEPSEVDIVAARMVDLTMDSKGEDET